MNRFHYNYDSSSESNSSLMKSTEEAQAKTQRIQKNSRPGIFIEPNVIGNVNGELTFAETCKRRQSFDPSLYRNKPNIVEEVDKDNWLHYQSLPNIQEEDQQSNLLSPDNQTGLLDPKDQLKPISTSLEIHYQSPASAPVIQIRTNPMANLPTSSATTSIKPEMTKIPSASIQPTSGSNTGTTSNYQPLKSMAATGSTIKKHSFKRQKSQEIPDEDIKIRLSQPSTSQNIIKQSSEDSQASSNSSTKGGIMPPGILRKRKENLKQASTESDTGSYHTVKSLVMHSSIDSFTSAVSESAGAGATAANNNANNNNNNSKNVTILLHQHNQNENPPPTIADNLLLSYSAIHESTLVPKIVFSQSTPSVTSQSSDDQNSPKWDERYSEFSSVETVAENPRTIRRKDSIKQKPTATSSAISSTTNVTPTTTRTITKSGINSSSSSKNPINR